MKKVSLFLAMIVGVWLLFSRGTGDVDYFAAWGREVSYGNLFDLYRGGPGGKLSYRLIDTYTGTIPYPPVFLYLIGGLAFIGRVLLDSSDTTFRFCANLLSFCGTVLVGLHFERALSEHRLNRYSRILLWGCLLYFAPVLGYQDSCALAALLIATSAVRNNKYWSAGILLAASIFIKQLAIFALIGIVFYLFADIRKKSLASTLKIGAGFMGACGLFLMPFVTNFENLKSLNSLIASSNHKVLSANGANLGWFATWVSGVVKNPSLDALRNSGNIADFFDFRIFSYSISSRTFFLTLMISAFILIFVLLGRNRIRGSRTCVVNVAAATYLSYCCLGTGIHENHAYIGLGLATYADLAKHGKVSRLTLVGWVLMSLHLYGLYGFGRSFASPQFSQLMVNSLFVAAFVVYCLILLRSIVWISHDLEKVDIAV